MIDRVRKSFEENLQSVTWMDEETQKKAIEKAVSISEMIGMSILFFLQCCSLFTSKDFNDSISISSHLTNG